MLAAGRDRCGRREVRLSAGHGALAVFFALCQQLENYLIAPRAMRSAVKLSPTAALLAALIGTAALGLIGALMAIPGAAGQQSCCPSASRHGTRPMTIPPAKAPGVMTNVSHGPTWPAHGAHTIKLPAGQNGGRTLRAALLGIRSRRHVREVGTMVMVELTKREADALSEATRLGDTDDLEALRTATDKLWKAANAQQHGGTWRIIHAA